MDAVNYAGNGYATYGVSGGFFFFGCGCGEGEGEGDMFTDVLCFFFCVVV